MTTVRLEISYDGGGFRGWAAQPGLRTVQGELETALATILREPVSLSVAGRTDAGVHARGQVASFTTGAEVPVDLARRVNGLGPRDVAVISAEPAPDGFDARRDARSRTYLYRLLARSAPDPLERGRALWWPHPIDRERLDACAALTIGVHDFTAFTPTQTDHVHFERNVLGCEWLEEPGEILAMRIEADAFMRSMVRVLVGTMLEVAGGRREIEDYGRLLHGAPRSQAADTAPAHGLYLVRVSY
jgi:tRNA pseudouridine38-40 synthase